MRDGNSFTRTDETSEALALKAKKKIDKDMRDALVDEEAGLFTAGALPKVTAASASGQKLLLDSIEKAGCVSDELQFKVLYVVAYSRRVRFPKHSRTGAASPKAQKEED